MSQASHRQETLSLRDLYSHGTFIQRVPWLWFIYVSQRVRLPMWALCVILYLVLYGITALFALAAGDLAQFLRDPRWALVLLPAPLGAFVTSYAPVALEQQLQRLQPWLTTPAEEIEAFRRATPRWLAWGFWIIFLVGVAFALPVLLLSPEQFYATRDYPRPDVMRLSHLPVLVMIYFVASGISLMVLGLANLLRRLQKELGFRRGFILQAGKAVFSPFHRLLWALWIGVALPTPAVQVALAAMANPADVQERVVKLQFYVIVSVGVLIFFLGIVVPHLFMNRLLARVKAEELKALAAELESAATPAPQPTEVGLLQQMHRHQHLVYQIQGVQAFTPSLIDIRFVVQVALSVIAIILANFLQKALLA